MRGAGTTRPPGRHPGADRGGTVDLAAARRVLLVRPDNIGDVVMLTPAVRAVRAAAPQAQIDLLASPAGAAVTSMIPQLSGVLVAAPSFQQLDPRRGDAREEHRLLTRIRRGRYDVMIVFTSFSQSPWPALHLGLLAGIGTRVAQSREFGGAVATHWVTPPPDTTHQVDRELHLLAAIGVPDVGRALRLEPPAAACAAAARLLPEPAAVLAPGASCAARRYPAERFAAAAAVIARAGLPVAVAGSPREAALVARVVRAAAHPDVTALSAMPLEVFTAVLARAAVAVTNNSGPLHLADAVGTPVVAVYAGTERPGDMAPRDVPARLLGVPVPCAPCRQLTCPFDHSCVAVAAQEVAAAALTLAAQHHREPVSHAAGRFREDRWGTPTVPPN